MVRLGVIGLVALLALGACATSTPTPSPSPTPVAIATPTPTSAPTPTPGPTATPTVVPSPTLDPTATPTSARTPTPTPLPQPGVSALEVACTARTATLMWSESPDVQLVRVERRVGTGSYVLVELLPAGVRTFHDAGLHLETAYAYRLTAPIGGGEEVVARATCTTTDGTVSYVPNARALSARYVPDGVEVTAQLASPCERVEWGEVTQPRFLEYVATPTFLRPGPESDVACIAVVPPPESHVYPIAATASGTFTVQVEGRTLLTFPLTPIANDQINAPTFSGTQPSDRVTRVSFTHDGVNLSHFEVMQRIGVDGPFDTALPDVAGEDREFLTDVLLLGLTYCWEIRAVSPRGTRSEPVQGCAQIAGTVPNTLIAYVSERDGNAEIYLEPDQRLTTRLADDLDPAWAPDGGHIAFVTSVGEVWQLRVMTGEGKDMRILTPDDTEGNRTPAWSPDSTRIVWSALRSGDWDLYVINPDGTGEYRLTSDAGADRNPRWSPDTTRIVFDGEREVDGVVNRDIYVVNADGTGLVRLTDHHHEDVTPIWSPDGSQIAFASRREGNWEIFTINADGTGLTRVTSSPGHAQEPAWSPDGQKIAYVLDGQINSINLVTGEQLELTASLGVEYSPVWSADGRWIAFVSTRDGDAEIFTMLANGSNETQITFNDDEDDSPDW